MPFNKNLDFKNETIALIQKVGLLFPSCRVIGWDIVLTPDGPHIFLKLILVLGLIIFKLVVNKG